MDEIDKVAGDLLTTAHHYQQNYEALKELHVSLKEDYSILEAEYVELLKESKLVKDKYVTMLNMANKDNEKLQKECKEAKKSVISPKQVEMIRLETREELRSEYQKKIDDLEKENSELLHKVSSLEQKHIYKEGDFEKKIQEKCNLVESLQSKIEKMEEEYSGNIKKIMGDHKNESMETELIQLRQENANLSQNVSELRAELKSKSSELQSQTLKHTKSYNKLKNSEIKIKNKNSEHQLLIEQLSEQKEQLFSQLEDTKRKAHQREKEFSTITKDMEEFRREIENMSSLAVSGVHSMEIDAKIKIEHERQKNKKFQLQIEELNFQIDAHSQALITLKRKLADKDVKLIREIESFQKKAAKTEAVHHRLRINAEKTCNELREQLEEKSRQHQKMEDSLLEEYEKKLSDQKLELSEKLNEATFMLNKMKSEQFLTENNSEEMSLTKKMLKEAVEKNNDLLEENKKMKSQIKSFKDSIQEEARKNHINLPNGKNRKVERKYCDDKVERLMSKIVEFEDKLHAQERSFSKLEFLTC